MEVMLYRKAPAQPTRMLLSVAAAGLFAGACSGSVTEGPVGSATMPDDAQADGTQGDDGSPGPCGGVCGVVIQDGGFCCGITVGSSSGGVVGFVGGGLFADSGSVAFPDAGAGAGSVDGGAIGPCGGVCGTIITGIVDAAPEQ